MITYTCDRCGLVLKHRADDQGGAHRLTIRDTIPWTPSFTQGAPSFPVMDLCGECMAVLRACLMSKVTR